MIKWSILLLFWLSPLGYSQTIFVSPLENQPVIDGSDADWLSVPGVTIAVKPVNPTYSSETTEVLLKAGHFDGEVFFYLRWRDYSENLVHKAWVWDESKKRYVMGPEREDRLAMQFEMEGEYSTDWANANDFKADMWHWKSSRSNPLGLVHDKFTVLSQNKLLRAAALPAADGSKRYVLRKSDAGEPLYRTMRFGKKKQEVMPKYELLVAQGSMADIQAKGIWKDGNWQLELRRKLSTGHDDVQFELGNSYLGGIAVFNASDNDDHLISETLQFQF
ncbi:MAG: ethylbenzene dehydrogenase-related protein [Neptuniibacter sp.]